MQRKNKIKSRARDVLAAMVDGETPPQLQKRCKNDWQNCVGVDTPGLKQAFAQVATEEKFAVLGRPPADLANMLFDSIRSYTRSTGLLETGAGGHRWRCLLICTEPTSVSVRPCVFKHADVTAAVPLP